MNCGRPRFLNNPSGRPLTVLSFKIGGECWFESDDAQTFGNLWGPSIFHLRWERALVAVGNIFLFVCQRPFLFLGSIRMRKTCFPQRDDRTWGSIPLSSKEFVSSDICLTRYWTGIIGHLLKSGANSSSSPRTLTSSLTKVVSLNEWTLASFRQTRTRNFKDHQCRSTYSNSHSENHQ